MREREVLIAKATRAHGHALNTLEIAAPTLCNRGEIALEIYLPTKSRIRRLL